MPIKILATMGSPHNGNSLEITQRIESKLVRLGDVNFERAHLKDVDLRPCRESSSSTAWPTTCTTRATLANTPLPWPLPGTSAWSQRSNTSRTSPTAWVSIASTSSATRYRHWKERGWLETETRHFNDNVRRNVFMDLIARFVGWMTGRQIDKAMGKVA